MTRIRLFGPAAEAAGRRTDTVVASDVLGVIDELRGRYGAGFASVLDTCAVWVDGAPAEPSTPLRGDEEVALLPPVSGG